ncbi:putative Serpin family protein [Helianthus annuus]|nr:putative Serpin family protein [Helianthus annuus]
MTFAIGYFVHKLRLLMVWISQNGSYLYVVNILCFLLTKAVEVAREVNSWAKKETNWLIKEVITAKEVKNGVKNGTMIILANAIYFKGTWSQQFTTSLTKERDFHLLNGNKVKVPFMTSSKNQFVHEYDGFKVLGLPYAQGQDKRKFTMYCYLSDAKDGLPSLVKKMSSTSDFFERHIPRVKEEVPKIHQKSVVEVNEEGTEAAAVSFGEMAFGCAATVPKVVDFVADHPFFFFFLSLEKM